MRIPLADVVNNIDFAIITIRDDEYLAVFDRLKPIDTTQNRRTYDIGTVNTVDGNSSQFALIRLVNQGEGTAQDVARDMIEDLNPKWLLLVGIAGAVPSTDFTLGDVICAIRVHDFCVRAVKHNTSDRFAAGGGPMHRSVENLLSRLPAIEQRLKGWNAPEQIAAPIPLLEVPQLVSDRYYGNKAWRLEVYKSLSYHFSSSNLSRIPHVTARPIASSDALIKNPKVVDQWLTEARAVAAIEMELAGVYIAARRHNKEYPILAIRGISDIVGFKRDDAWTKYACNTAAAFTLALLQSGELLSAQSQLPTYTDHADLSSSKAKEIDILHQRRKVTPEVAIVLKDFSQGKLSGKDIGLDFPNLKFMGWLSQRGKSIVAKYRHGDMAFVIKKTSSAYVDPDILGELCNHIYSGHAWRLTANIATPLAVKVVEHWVYELHTYYDGVRVDRLVGRNKYRICGDYLGAVHNSLAFALDQLHRDGYVHRDVRPQNLIILSDGSLVLLDCSFVCRQNNFQNRVDSGVYTAPEQLEGKAIAQSDWYSMAATLLFIAFGYPPPRSFSREAADDLLERVLDIGAFYAPESTSVWCENEYDYSILCIWLEMLSSDPFSRPKNISDVQLGEHSRALFGNLIAVLDMESLGYLLLNHSGFDVVPRSDIDTKLANAYCENIHLRDSIKKHLQGHPEWVIGE